MTRLRRAIDEAARALTEAGIDTARVDAELLAAHTAGVDRGQLGFHDPDEPFFDAYRTVVDARSRRIPLQHLTATAAFGPLLLDVGPGVFIPRPETEAMLEWALGQRLSDVPLVVDLCAGSGALALAIAHGRPDAHVIAVDDSALALAYTRRNCAGHHVEVIEADVTVAGVLCERDGTVDLVVANPPYLLDGARLEPEVAEHEPAHALFGGPDGMQIITPIVALAARLLRPGGHVAVEHDDDTAALTVALFEQTGAFTDVTSRRDLAGRPRFVTATRSGHSPKVRSSYTSPQREAVDRRVLGEDRQA